MIVLKEKMGQQVPAGTHIAVCFRIVAVGTQPDSGYGAHEKLVIFWELPHERIEYEGKERPMAISKIYSLGSSGGMNKKSALRQDLQAWRGREFTKEELEHFELRNILGKACQVQVEHNDEGRAKVTRVVGLAKGTQCPPAQNPLVEYSYDEGKNETYEKLPDWIKEMLGKCLEWTGGKPEAPSATAELPPVEDDSVPF